MRAGRGSHLLAVTIAAGIAFAMLGGAGFYGRRLEERYIHTLAPEVLKLKNQGRVLQRDAFHQRDVLPLYGSSELVKPIPDKASRFFRKYPTDFTVCPVGKAGTTSINILQKLAAVGDEARGRKVAISLSPGWFFVESLDPRYYEGNFSSLQASAFAFSDELSPEVKREGARRLLAFPKTLTKMPVASFALQHLSTDSVVDRFLYEASRPLGKLELAVLTAQDHYEVALSILQRHLKSSTHRHPTDLDWDELIARVTRHMEASGEDSTAVAWVTEPAPDTDAVFRETLAKANEWTDLDLLIRGMKDLGVEPLLLSMPINGVFFERAGISRASRELYVDRLRALAAKHEVALVDFDEYEEDPTFLADHHDHLSVKGWMYFNRALDAFMHDRLPEFQRLLRASRAPAHASSSAGT